MAVFSGYSPPTQSTFGSIGDIYIDLNTCVAYKCVATNSSVTDYGFVDIRQGRSESYIWVEGYSPLMSRTLNATTENEVREALLYATSHPGAYLNIVLAEGLNVTLPDIVLRNSTVYIVGTQVDGANTNTIAFEPTSSTHNMMVLNSAMTIQNLTILGSHIPTHTTAGYGIVRSHYGSSLYCSNVTFDKTEDSGPIGNAVEAMSNSSAYLSECTFDVTCTAANASAVHVIANSEGVTYHCSMAEDSVSGNIARVEKGSRFNQIGTNLPVYLPNGHASLCYVDGVLTTT